LGDDEKMNNEQLAVLLVIGITIILGIIGYILRKK
jgi:LPXTG-motif cell wall-anchored protein